MANVSIDPQALRAAFGCFLTGVTVVTTTEADGTLRGFTANSFTSVSLDPPLLLVSIAKSASSHAAFQQARHFAVNILAEEQRDLSNIFASKRADKFEHLAVRRGALGSPLIETCCAWFECRVHDRIEAGDHTLLIGEVVDFSSNPRPPLGYCRGGYVNLGLEQSAVLAASEQGTRVGAIIEAADCIAFDPPREGRWRLPSAPSLGPRSAPTSLLGRFAREGLAVRLSFLFSVYSEPSGEAGGTEKDEPGPAMRIFYRGSLSSPWTEAGTLRPVSIAELDFAAMDLNEARMLKRYVEERRRNAFGIYSESSEREHSLIAP